VSAWFKQVPGCGLLNFAAGDLLVFRARTSRV
jgi:hypothetical protein